LQNVVLEQALIDAPPLDLWPEQRARIAVPEDVQREVLDHPG
jgi:hypothetical protein